MNEKKNVVLIDGLRAYNCMMFCLHAPFSHFILLFLSFASNAIFMFPFTWFNCVLDALALPSALIYVYKVCSNMGVYTSIPTLIIMVCICMGYTNFWEKCIFAGNVLYYANK